MFICRRVHGISSYMKNRAMVMYPRVEGGQADKPTVAADKPRGGAF